MAKRIIPDANGTEANVLLDKRLISAPPLAVSQCMERTIEMAEGAKDALHEALASILDFKEKAVSGVEEKEQMLDEMEDKLSTFLLELSSVSLTDSDSRTVTELLHCISDFSEMTVKTFSSGDTEIAFNVEPLEEVIDDLTKMINDKHIERLRKGECSPELGVYLTDLLINCERVSDHCSNVAVSIIQIANSSMNSHDYLNGLKAERSPQFIESYNAYGQKYRLAIN